MTNARERLEAAIRDVLVNVSIGTSLVQQIADAVERALAPEPPAPLKVWPGLEGKGLLAVLKAYNTAYDAATQEDPSREAWTAAAPHLWRALVASLPGLDVVRIGEGIVSRAALAALADPYDGGGK